MPPIVRTVFAILAGIVAGFVVVVAFELAGSAVFPLPGGVDPMNREAIRAIADQIPLGAFVMVVAGWAVGTLVGAWLAGRLAPRARAGHSLVVMGVLLAMAVINLLLIPHPGWVWIVGIAGILICGFTASRMAARAKVMA